jgi:cytochrome c oxidase assembly protein subunit 11
MGSITAASPTLYTMFCKATGYNGTTQRAEGNAGKVLDRTITVRFDSNVSPKLPWSFEPDVPKMTVKIGETALAFFRATNNSDKPVTGQAVYNVTPEAFGAYFNKIECFCFKEQTLRPHQTVEMPVTFFVDPKMVDDSDTASQPEVTLSYVFFPAERPAATADATPPPPKTGG